MFFDSHNHLQSPRFGESISQLVDEMKAVGISGCVVNATRESAWDATRALTKAFPDFVRPAYGIHPWFADTAEVGWEDRLRKLLDEDPQATVGEVGVDGWVESPGMEVQQKIFSAQVAIAAEAGRIMTVHCLKAWEELFATMDRVETWPEKFLMHSFGGSSEIAERIMKRDGAMFSFSGYFLHERKAKVLEVFKKLPQDRILLETDAPEMMPPDEFVKFPLGENINHPANMSAIAEEFEREMGAGTSDRIRENGRQFWGVPG